MRKRTWCLSTVLCSSIIALGFGVGTVAADDNGNQGHNGQPAGSDPADSLTTESPIKHVIILIGENRGFDHTFGIFQPKGKGQTVSNILSKGIVNADGTPGPNFGAAQQFSVTAQPTWYFGAPDASKSPYGGANLMPQPSTNGAPSTTRATSPPFQTVAQASVEPDIDSDDVVLLTTGATGLAMRVLDTRVKSAGTLSGPFPLQNGDTLTDDDYTGDTTHRFFSAAQQQDCSIVNATRDNPTGCLNDLFPFVMGTFSATDSSQGNEMGFYNAERGQATLLKELADRFTLSDNFHQSVLGGTAANHAEFGHAAPIFWSDGNGNPTTPPVGIANPNPVAGTVNQYTVDGNFVNCSDTSNPGVAPIVDYLGQLPYRPKPNCQTGAFYMVNNVNPGYLPNGTVVPSVQGAVPPSAVRSIGDALVERNIPWSFYGGSFNDAVILANEAVAANPANPNLTAAALADPAHALGLAYCQICNPFQYDTSVMGDPAARATHLHDTGDLVTAIRNNTLPAVAIGKPDTLLDGHPQTSKIDLFESYVQHLLEALQSNSHLLAETAVFITWDEAGGYWDSGFVQPVDFFGDGPRIPLLVLSPYSTGGMVNHSYADHVSLVKFIERNWGLDPLTATTRDNLPNPKSDGNNPYVPKNMPALDDLFDAFDFHGNKANVQPYIVTPLSTTAQ